MRITYYMRGGPHHDLVWNSLGGDTTEGTMRDNTECSNVAFAAMLAVNF